jgi:ribosomal protein S17E
MPIKINREETNLEILARIAKATAQKYDCSMTIDFQNGNRRIEFSGNPAAKEKIANTMAAYFTVAAYNDTIEASRDPGHR